MGMMLTEPRRRLTDGGMLSDRAANGKRVWIVKQYAVTPDLPGNTRHFELGRRLAERGYDITILASGFHYSQHRDIGLGTGESIRVERVDGVRFVWIRCFPFQRNDWRRVVHMLDFMWRAYWVGRRLPRRTGGTSAADVVLGCSVPPFAALAGYWLSRRFRSRFLLEVGDLWPQTLIDMGALSRRNPIARLLHRLEVFLYRRAERIITPLPNAAGYIARQGVEEDRVVWIPNGVDVKAFSTVEPAVSSEFVVMYAGVHGHAQSLETIVEAAGIVQRRGISAVKFVLVGDGPEKPRLRELSKRNGIENVEFRDSVPRNQIPEVLGAARAVIFSLRDTPTFREYGVGSKKLFDYLATGVPVIFAVRAANDPVSEAGCGVTVAPDDAASLAEAVVQLYGLTEEERRAMGERARKYAEAHHDWSILAERFEVLINGDTKTIERGDER